MKYVRWWYIMENQYGNREGSRKCGVGFVDRKASLLRSHLGNHLKATWERALWICEKKEIGEDYRDGQEASMAGAEAEMRRAVGIEPGKLKEG